MVHIVTGKYNTLVDSGVGSGASCLCFGRRCSERDVRESRKKLIGKARCGLYTLPASPGSAFIVLTLKCSSLRLVLLRARGGYLMYKYYSQLNASTK